MLAAVAAQRQWPAAAVEIASSGLQGMAQQSLMECDPHDSGKQGEGKSTRNMTPPDHPRQTREKGKGWGKTRANLTPHAHMSADGMPTPYNCLPAQNSAPRREHRHASRSPKRPPFVRTCPSWRYHPLCPVKGEKQISPQARGIHTPEGGTTNETRGELPNLRNLFHFKARHKLRWYCFECCT